MIPQTQKKSDSSRHDYVGSHGCIHEYSIMDTGTELQITFKCEYSKISLNYKLGTMCLLSIYVSLLNGKPLPPVSARVNTGQLVESKINCHYNAILSLAFFLQQRLESSRVS
jgi:hypothetical protein